MFHGLLRPGQGFRYFTVLKSEGGVAKNGRPEIQVLKPFGRIAGMIMRASHGEVEQWKSRNQWKQEGHPITHKVIQYGSRGSVNPSDILELVQSSKTRRFVVKGIQEPAELNHFTVFFVEEREDLQ